MKDEIWVYLETNADGSAKPLGAELITAARLLSEQSGYGVTAVIMGHSISAEIYGAKRVIALDDPVLATYDTEIYAHALCSLTTERPAALIMGATANGRDLAPRVAARMETGLTAECTGARWDSSMNLIIWTRPTFGGRLMAEIVCEKTFPQMGTISAGAFEPYKGQDAPPSERVKIDFSGVEKRVSVLRSGDGAAETEALTKADIILSGGKGLGSEGFRLLEELARKTGAELGASRAAVEAGWTSAARQIGQSGQSVRPKRYVAFGVSGAQQHLIGMKDAQHIIAVNSDPAAPIFEVADIGIIGNAKEILAEMM